MSLSKPQIVGIIEDAMVTYDGTVGTLPILDYGFIGTGVNFVQTELDAAASALHVRWMQWMKDNGWQRGINYTSVAKLHPDMIPFEELSADVQRRWILFRNMVRALGWF